MDSDWLPDEQIEGFFKKTKLLRAYVAESPLRAANSSNDFLVMIRDHDAWEVDGAWCDANRPPEQGDTSQQFLNYWDKTTWSKLCVPQSSLIESVEWEGDSFLFTCKDRTFRASPKQVRQAVMDAMTGWEISEEDIELNFQKLDGSLPS